VSTTLHRRVAAVLVIAVLGGVAAIAYAGSAASQSNEKHSYAFGSGTHGPGCAEDVPPPGVPFCYQVSITYSLLAVQRGNGHAWGLITRLNNGNGFRRTDEVTCMTVADGKAAIGGIETSPPSGLPVLLYVDDRGPIGSLVPDRISAEYLFPEGDPAWSEVPPDFPRTCPSPNSFLGYYPLTSGDLSVTDD
jgi:hypothetical protein